MLRNRSRHVDTEYHRAMGENLGYPKCCIDSFCSGRFAYCLTEDERDMIGRQSIHFVPCPEHTRAMMNGLDLSALVDNRPNLKHKDLMAIKDMVLLLLLRRSKIKKESHVNT